MKRETSPASFLGTLSYLEERIGTEFQGEVR